MGEGKQSIVQWLGLDLSVSLPLDCELHTCYAIFFVCLFSYSDETGWREWAGVKCFSLPCRMAVWMGDL